MAYYAALVSLVKLLEEMSLSENQYPKSLFQKQQITSFHEKFSHLQVLLENYSGNNKEAAGFLDRIRVVACQVEHFIECQNLDAACRERVRHMPDAACRERRPMPDAAYEAKYLIESQIRKPNCLAEIIHKSFHSILVSACRNSQREVAKTVRKGSCDLSKLAKQLEYILEIGYEKLVMLKNETDSIMGLGYLDWVKWKKEIDSIVIEGYQGLVKLKEELDGISSKWYQDLDSVEVVELVVGKGHQELERVKEEVESLMGQGYDDLLEKIMKKEVDPIVEEMITRMKNSHTTHQEDLQVAVGGPSDEGPTMVVLDEKPSATIKAQLFGDSSKLKVISIVGMGGIGKTTSARHIFNDIGICNHFDIRVWVTVSQSYHLLDILRSILDSLNINHKRFIEEKQKELDKRKENLNQPTEKVNEEEELKGLTYKNLFGKRYLIIMDDVWDTKIWDDVKWILPSDNKSRSRIIVTTRQSNVASLATESEFINQIPILTHCQSWTLFCEKVHCPPELEDIGRSIVRNCGGLPLAIVVIAGLLSKINKTRDHWGDIARRVSSSAAENDERFIKILSLSYDHLPQHLKPCFLYLGGFPEDYEISISRLVKLWVAEGFLKPVASKCLEEAAEEYLEELVKRNLVLVTKHRSNGKFRSCIMHDILRDLCLQRAHQEHFLLLPQKHNATYHHIHRFFIHPDSQWPYDIDMRKNNVFHLRSIVSFCNKFHFISYPSSFKPLRVLDAPYASINFSHLRYFAWNNLINLKFLALVVRHLSDIPSSIFQLQNLQTLIVHESCLSKILLPDGIWRMPKLRHVLICNGQLPPISYVSDRLPSLQTLSTLLNCTFTSGIVQMIPSIKKLKLKYRDFSNGWAIFGLRNLVHLHQLETLAIEIDGTGIMPFPESFAFSLNLRKLTLKGCRLPWENMTAVGALPQLQVLKLRENSFVGEEWESKEGEFSMLKFLEMFHLLTIENWLTESTHFPCLEHLIIKYCDHLEEIPSETGEFPNLKLMEVWASTSRVKASALEIQEEQLSLGNETLQVRVY